MLKNKLLAAGLLASFASVALANDNISSDIHTYVILTPSAMAHDPQAADEIISQRDHLIGYMYEGPNGNKSGYFSPSFNKTSYQGSGRKIDFIVHPFNNMIAWSINLTKIGNYDFTKIDGSPDLCVAGFKSNALVLSYDNMLDRYNCQVTTISPQ